MKKLLAFICITLFSLSIIVCIIGLSYDIIVKGDKETIAQGIAFASAMILLNIYGVRDIIAKLKDRKENG